MIFPGRWTAGILALTLAFPVAARQNLSGRLRCEGSDTMAGLMSLWAEHFSSLHPAVRIDVSSSGSESAPVCLENGSCQIASMSRPLSEAERRSIARHRGRMPQTLEVAMDEVVFFVHPSNPLRELSRAQLRNLLFEGTGSRLHWGKGKVAGGEIRVYGRSGGSGTREFLRACLLPGGRYRAGMREVQGAGGVVHAVAADPAGLGYGSASLLDPGVRRIALHESGNASLVLRRSLWLVVVPAPGGAGLERAFLRLVLTRGQDEVLRSGLELPSPAAARRNLSILGEEP